MNKTLVNKILTYKLNFHEDFLQFRSFFKFVELSGKKNPNFMLYVTERCIIKLLNKQPYKVRIKYEKVVQLYYSFIYYNF